jgi:hypothetical protein
MLTLLDQRAVVYELTVTASDHHPDALAAAAGVDAVVLDGSTVQSWTAVDHRIFTDGLETLGFIEVSHTLDVEVYIRGGTSTR